MATEIYQGTPADVLASFTEAATKELGADFTCKKIHVGELQFKVAMGRRFRDQYVFGGEIIGLLLEARQQQVSGVLLFADLKRKPE